MASRVYVCDADSLINLHRHFGRKAITVLKRLSNNGQLKLPEGIVRELIRGTDRLARYAEKERASSEVLIPLHSDLSKEVKRLEQMYGERIRFGKNVYAGFWKSKSEKLAADAQVVAVARKNGRKLNGKEYNAMPRLSTLRVQNAQHKIEPILFPKSL